MMTMPLAGRRIMIVEDEFLLAMTLEEDLAAAGGTVIGPFTTLTDAVAAVGREAFDIAVLDINLNGEMSYPAAEALIETGRPFVFLTGYSDISVPERFRSFRRLSKPYPTSRLIELLASDSR